MRVWLQGRSVLGLVDSLRSSMPLSRETMGRRIALEEVATLLASEPLWLLLHELQIKAHLCRWLMARACWPTSPRSWRWDVAAALMHGRSSCILLQSLAAPAPGVSLEHGVLGIRCWVCKNSCEAADACCALSREPVRGASRGTAAGHALHGAGPARVPGQVGRSRGGCLGVLCFGSRIISMQPCGMYAQGSVGSKLLHCPGKGSDLGCAWRLSALWR